MKTVMRFINSMLMVAAVVMLAACAKNAAGPESDQASARGYAAQGGRGATAYAAGTRGAIKGRVTPQQLQQVASNTNSIYFCFDNNSVNPAALQPLPKDCGLIRSQVSSEENALNLVNVYAHYLLKHPRARVRLEGNTDIRGSREYNVALGERRSLSVAQLLEAEGVNPQQIMVVSYGKEKPSDLADHEIAHSKNRRVDLKLQEG
jgi:peptidoglycan-associated lipoprotein